MTSLDEIRQAVVAAFKAVHEAYYPTTPVNYPGWAVVDVERQTEPFVSLELDLTGIDQAALGETELRVPAAIMVYFHYREGKGMSGSLLYTDMLNAYLGQTQVGSIRYQVAKPIQVSLLKGWELPRLPEHDSHSGKIPVTPWPRGRWLAPGSSRYPGIR